MLCWKLGVGSNHTVRIQKENDKQKEEYLARGGAGRQVEVAVECVRRGEQ